MGWMPEKAREMFDKLVNMALRLGRDPSFKEVEQDPTMPHPNDFAYYFGSFSEAQKQAHRAAFVYKKRETQLPPGKIFSDEEEEAMSRQAIPDQEYVVGIMRLKKELGRFPTILETNNDRRSPSVTSYQRRFGVNWSAMPKIIKQRAEDLGITEDNYEQFVVEKPVPKPKPVPALNPEEDDAGGEGVADGILGPEEEQVTDSIPVTEAESVPELEAELMRNTPASLPILSELASDPVLPTEVEPEGNKLISLLPQTRILEPKVEGYASVFVTKGLVPLQKTVVGVPVSRNYCGLNLILNGRTILFPEPSENVFYIVERKIASVAKAAGRETYDLLIPEKYDRDENGMKITEFSIL